MKSRILRPTLFLLVISLGLTAAEFRSLAQEEMEVALTSETDYAKVAAQISPEEITRTVQEFASLGSRVTGYPGCERAAQIVEQRFRAAGLQDVTVDEFPVMSPRVSNDQRPATLQVGDKEFVIYPLWPNLVRTPQTPPEGISGPLLYGGNGSFAAFNGQPVPGSLALLDFNCQSQWLNAPLLGAKAVLFIEPEQTIRGEAEQKFLSIPADVPRYWVPREVADYCLGLLATQGEVRATVRCDMKWQRVTAKNIMGTIPGTDPRLKSQRVVIQAYYDSISIVPSLAPGAESAASIAALFQLIKAFQAQPPKRTVVFLATSGHFQALAGEKRFVMERVRGARADGYVRYCFNVANEARRNVEGIADRLWGEEIGPGGQKTMRSPEEQLRGLKGLLGRVRAAKARTAKIERKAARGLAITDPNAGKLAVYRLPEEEVAKRQRLLTEFQQRVPVIRQAAEQAEAAIRQARSAGQATEEALKPVQEATYALIAALDFAGEDVALWYSVDLSSHNPAFGIFFKGYFYNYAEGMQWKFADVGKKAREYAALVGQALSVDPAQRFVDGINALQGKNWQTYMAGHLGLGSEVGVLAGIPAMGLATINDGRPLVDTPRDLPERMNPDNLVEQTRFLACLLCDLVSVTQPRDLYKIELEDNFVEAKGRLVQFDPAVSTFPDKPVLGGIATVRNVEKTAMGVRKECFDAVDDEGRFDLAGLPNVRAVGGKTKVEGFLTDPQDGSIEMAPDLGVNGATAYPIEVDLDQPIKPVTVVMFECKPVALYDMVDQRFFDLLQQIYVYDAGLEAEPYTYGYCLPLPPRRMVSNYEPVGVVFAPPGTRLRVTMAASLLGLRFLLLNPAPGKPEGDGYLVDETPSIYMSPYLVARDMWTLDEQRIGLLQQYGITNNLVNEAHRAAKEQLEKASEFLRQWRYDEFITAARAAWALESRAYPAVRATANDVVKGIIFYMALLLPFSFFLERLLIGHPDLKWQLLGTGGIFLGIFIILYLVHPAFALSKTSIVILLAFVILALGALVISIIVGKFEEQMKQVKYEQTGVHTADVGRLSASAAAFSLGVSNMRRRKTRTLLTCLTLILLTFTVMSFTSVVQSVRANKILIPKLAPYNGVLIRDKTWLPIGEVTYGQMATEFGNTAAVAGRAWYFSAEIGKQSFVDVSRGSKSYMATAMLGMMPSEAEITRPQEYLIPGSRWFRPTDENVCILPEGVAKALDVAPKDIGTATVSVFGNRMTVIGILASSRFKTAQDLDGEVLTPVDFLVMQQQMAQAQVEESRGRSMKGGEMQEYIHLVPDAVVIVPYQFAMNHNATLRSVAIATRGEDAEKAAERVLNRLITRVELNLYAGVGGKTYLCSAVAATGVAGMSNVLIPILIAAAIVLNTMLGSVYERVREIYIYSSLGLAPNHVAALFIAEASVYAVLGAIAGYLVGQMAAKVITAFHLSASLNLNYSSLSAVATTLVIMATVLASVMYPARRASDIAMPGIERRWSLPEPEGDVLHMRLPFTVTGDQALGVNMYLREFLMAHTDYSLGQFSTADITLRREQYEKGEGLSLASMVWLAPYDLGVSERLIVETVPTDDPEIFNIEATIVRQSGDDASWMRVTRNFINIIRKQYLLWRTFPAAQKGEYGKNALLLLEGRLVEEEGAPASVTGEEPTA